MSWSRTSNVLNWLGWFTKVRIIKCGKCALITISAVTMLWGSLGSSPTRGHQAGVPSVIQKVLKTPEARAYNASQQQEQKAREAKRVENASKE